MSNSRYYKQVALLLSVIPEIAIEPKGVDYELFNSRF